MTRQRSRLPLAVLALLALPWLWPGASTHATVGGGSAPSAATAAADAQPAVPAGIVIPEDRYHYHFGWQGIPAFTGTIQATRHDDLRPWYHFRLEGGTRRWLDLIYRMQDTVDAYVDGVTYLPQLFYARLRAPRDNTNMVVKFDHNRGIADVRTEKNGKEKTKEIPFRRGNDPVSVLLMLQSLREPGDESSFEVVNGKRNYQVALRVLGREHVKVKGGSFDTLVIEPKLTRLDKPDYKPKFKEMTVWVTEGETRIPVKLVSKVFIGKVTGELVKVTPRDDD
ncbi:MAG: DUF3108 domain-containing protein [Myxococcota bacterium]